MQNNSAMAPYGAQYLSVVWTGFLNLSGASKTEHSASWPKLVSLLKNPQEYPTKEAMPLMSGAVFGDLLTGKNSLRHDANVRAVHMLVGDYDAEHVTIDDAAERLRNAGVMALIFPTASHTPEAPRWRVLAPLSQACDREAFPACMALLNGALGGILAGESGTLSQSFYVGRVMGKPWHLTVIDGSGMKPIDTDEVRLFIDPIPVKASKKAASGSEVGDNPPVVPMTDDEIVDFSAVLARAGAEFFGKGTHPTFFTLMQACKNAELCGHPTVRDEFAGLVLEHGSDNKQREWARDWEGWQPKTPWRWVFDVLGQPMPTATGLPEVADSELATAGPELPYLERTAKTSRPKATTANLFNVLVEPAHAGVRLGLDNFRDEIMRAPIGTEGWRRFGDADYVALCIHLTRGPLRFEEPARDKLRDVVHAVAQQNRFDSAILWLEGLPVWDGVPRINSFFSTYGGVDDTPYSRAVGAYLWTALAGRVLVPGCKADMVPVLSGPQGFRKSSLVAAIPPDPEFFAEIDLAAKDDDTARLLRGKLVGELPELKGMRRREVEAMKSFITKQHEHWIPKYREFETTFPRRLVFIGTTNESEFLQDETGNRRWLPMTVTRPCDPEGVARGRDQLWAEAAARFKARGVAFLEAERLALTEHESYLEHDAWTDRITNWLSYAEIDPDEGIGTDEIAVQVLGIEAGRINRDTQGRIGRAMKNVPGFIKKKVRRGGGLVWRYMRK